MFLWISVLLKYKYRRQEFLWKRDDGVGKNVSFLDCWRVLGSNWLTNVCWKSEGCLVLQMQFSFKNKMQVTKERLVEVETWSNGASNTTNIGWGRDVGPEKVDDGDGIRRGCLPCSLSEKVNAKGFKSLTYPSPNPGLLGTGKCQQILEIFRCRKTFSVCTHAFGRHTRNIWRITLFLENNVSIGITNKGFEPLHL